MRNLFIVLPVILLLSVCSLMAQEKKLDFSVEYNPLTKDLVFTIVNNTDVEALGKNDYWGTMQFNHYYIEFYDETGKICGTFNNAYRKDGETEWKRVIFIQPGEKFVCTYNVARHKEGKGGVLSKRMRVRVNFWYIFEGKNGKNRIWFEKTFDY